MKKLNQWFKSGKGRGLRIFTIISFLIAATVVFFGLYPPLNNILKSQPVTEFIKTIPTFEIKNGEITNNQLQWTGTDPITGNPIFIDTSVDELKLPVPEYGAYITRKGLYFVSPEDVTTKSLPQKHWVISSEFVADFSAYWLIFMSLFFFVFIWGALWLLYLASVSVTYLFASLIKVKTGDRRVWRISAFSVLSLFILNILLILVSLRMGMFLNFGWGLIFLITVLNLILLAKNK